MDGPAPEKWKPAAGDFAYAQNDVSGSPGTNGRMQSNTAWSNQLHASGGGSSALTPTYNAPRWGVGTPLAQRGVPGASQTAPDVAGYLAQNAAPSPEDSQPMVSPQPDAWNTGALKPMIGAKERWGTALDAPVVSSNALGPRATALRDRRMAGYSGERHGGSGEWSAY